MPVMDLTPPPRGFARAEFEARTEAAQRLMHQAGLDALVVTTEPEFRYFTGFLSQFWESPTRPWFIVVPSEGKPIGVIPSIGAAGLAETWVDDIRTWSSPDPVDDGVTLLTQALRDVSSSGSVGFSLGAESRIRMPVADFERVRAGLGGISIGDSSPIMRELRVVKSEAEVAKVRQAARVASSAFETLAATLRSGMTEHDACAEMRIEMTRLGADSTPYVMGASGSAGYDNIIMGPTDRVLGDGDIMLIDTGATYDGYFCDFDRQFAFGSQHDAAIRAYDIVYEATDAGFAAARPGVTTHEVWRAMWDVLERGGALGNDVGRMGHGLGMQLTEWPSFQEGGDVVLEEGMVLTLEPGMEFAPGKHMVHEENIVIRDGEAEYLSVRARPEMYAIS